MKKSIAMKWVAALESGEYKQTTGKLRQGNSFCCLGVLCNLHAQEFPEIAKTQKKRNSYLGEFGELPEKVQEWSEMSSDEGDFYDPSTLREYSLINMNDKEGKTFEQIAKVIRKYYKEL